MSLPYVILGLLSQGPASGYQLKKTIADSPFLPWSGNNNQIYRTLIDLEARAQVISEVQHQADGPTKKVYHLTDAGRISLREWQLREPEAPVHTSDFLLRLLAWTDLGGTELASLVTRYEERLHDEGLLLDRPVSTQAIPGPSSAMADLVRELLVDLVHVEAAWCRKARTTLATMKGGTP